MRKMMKDVDKYDFYLFLNYRILHKIILVIILKTLIIIMLILINIFSNIGGFFVAAWQAIKTPLLALAIGLVAGPLIAASAGWTVWSGAAKAQLRASVVEQGASYCAARVRTDVGNPGALSFDERSALAKKWSMAPGSSEPDADITQACAFKLAD